MLVFIISLLCTVLDRSAPDIVDTCTFRVAGAGSGGRSRHCGTEAISCDSEWGHVFLGLKQDDVNLWGEEAAENNRTTQTDGDTHGGGLHLWGGGDTDTVKFVQRPPSPSTLHTYTCYFNKAFDPIRSLTVLFCSCYSYSQNFKTCLISSQPFCGFPKII